MYRYLNFYCDKHMRFILNKLYVYIMLLLTIGTILYSRSVELIYLN